MEISRLYLCINEASAQSLNEQNENYRAKTFYCVKRAPSSDRIR